MGYRGRWCSATTTVARGDQPGGWYGSLTAARRTGLGGRLMFALETHARAVGFTLVTLDTHRASPAELLYRGLGWTACGVIPGSLDGDGQLADTTVFYKQLP